MSEIILKVPLLNQPKGSPHCAVASMRMLMAYHGETLSHDEAVKHFPEIDTTRIGITPATARFLVQGGYDVTYKMHQKDLISDDIKDKTEDDLELFKEYISSNDLSESAQRQWEQILKFIEVGGNFSTKLPTLDDIDSYLEKGIPVRVGIKCSIFYSKPNNEANHAVVIIGKKDERYLINDPAPRFIESYWIDKKQLEDAWRANGSLLFVATKK